METSIFIVLGMMALLAVLFLAIRPFISPMMVIHPSVAGPVSDFLSQGDHDASEVYGEDETPTT